MLDGAEYSSSAECLGRLNPISKKKKSSKNRRRFSDEQIRSLEVMFESETKLEPRKKAQLARELGLQPQQIAIWFQNKRARWKSKHIEKEYSILLAKYNNLAAQFESRKKEKQSLLTQLQKLKSETMGKSDHQKENEFSIQEGAAAGNSSSDGESDSRKLDFEVKNIGSRCLEGMQLSEDDDSIKAEFLAQLDDEENHELLKLVEPAAAAESSLTSAEDWGSLDSDDMMNLQANDRSFQWWDFWP